MMLTWMLLLGLGAFVNVGRSHEYHPSLLDPLHLVDERELVQCDVSSDHEFSYNPEDPYGPDNWSKVSSCCSETSQSPIDIPLIGASRYCQPALKFTSSGPVDATLVNSGHTVKCYGFSGETLLERVPGFNDSEVFSLGQLHLHWGDVGTRASEHMVNGQGFTGEMHLVFFNKKYDTIGAAVQHKDGLAVVGIFLTEWILNSNQELSSLLDSATKVVLPDSKTSVRINPTALLPIFSKFATYPGSLTTPPCSENVRWIVMLTPHFVSSEKMKGLRELMSSNKDEPIAFYGNERPVQPLNGRTVQSNLLCW